MFSVLNKIRFCQSQCTYRVLKRILILLKRNLIKTTSPNNKISFVLIIIGIAITRTLLITAWLSVVVLHGDCYKLTAKSFKQAVTIIPRTFFLQVMLYFTALRYNTVASSIRNIIILLSLCCGNRQYF